MNEGEKGRWGEGVIGRINPYNPMKTPGYSLVKILVLFL
jgi:hypothetical protein